MREFIEAFMFIYCILSTYVIYCLARRLKKKVKKEDIENYILDNFLDLDL